MVGPPHRRAERAILELQQKRAWDAIVPDATDEQRKKLPKDEEKARRLSPSLREVTNSSKHCFPFSAVAPMVVLRIPLSGTVSGS